MRYADFLASKRRQPPTSGINVHPDELLTADNLFPFQRQITAWSVGRGRAAVWADTGLGKTRIETGWLNQLLSAEGGRGLTMGPLGVAKQTIREAARMGVEIAYVHDDSEVRKLISKRAGAGPQIAFCNYDRLHLLDTTAFTAVALDESSILKAFSGTTKRALVTGFARTPFRLSASATPAPNDLEELCNHADFLGIMTAQEMRSTFFIADSRGTAASCTPARRRRTATNPPDPSPCPRGSGAQQHDPHHTHQPRHGRNARHQLDPVQR